MATAVKTYEYSVRDRKGKLVKGTLDAQNESALVQQLKGMGYAPVSVRETGAGMQREITLPGGNRITLKDLAIMSRQFATMVNCGLSLLRSLSILADQTENKALAKVLDEVRNDLEGGSALSAVARQAPAGLPADHGQHDPRRRDRRLPRQGAAADRRELRGRGPAARQGEERDDLPGRRLRHRDPRGGRHAAVHRAGLREDVRQPRRRAAGADAGARVPLDGDEVGRPVPSSCSASPSSSSGSAIKHRQDVREFVDPLKLKLADLRRALPQDRDLAGSPATSARCSRAGVPILQSLDIVAETSGNAVVGKAIRAVQDSVRRGESLARPLADHPVFPPMVVQMMAVGEDTGALDQMLRQDHRLLRPGGRGDHRGLTALIEPLMIAFLGGIVGSMIVALYMPIFKVFDLIQ